MDNLFDWEKPDENMQNLITEYGEQELTKVKRRSFFTSFFLFIIFEFWPTTFSILLINEFYLGNDVIERLTISLSSIILVLLFSIAYYYYNVRSKKKLLSDIKSNKIKTISTVVREKKKRNSILVQLLGEELSSYKIPRMLHKDIESGTSLLAIKYENCNGFNDKYDFILNPNTIAEDD